MYTNKAKKSVGQVPTSTSMVKRNSFDSSQIMYRANELMKAANNRYQITVMVAKRAKSNRLEDMENYDDAQVKPVMRAIIEMSDELTEPEIIAD